MVVFAVTWPVPVQEGGADVAPVTHEPTVWLPAVNERSATVLSTSPVATLVPSIQMSMVGPGIPLITWTAAFAACELTGLEPAIDAGVAAISAAVASTKMSLFTCFVPSRQDPDGCLCCRRDFGGRVPPVTIAADTTDRDPPCPLPLPPKSASCRDATDGGNTTALGGKRGLPGAWIGAQVAPAGVWRAGSEPRPGSWSGTHRIVHAARAVGPRSQPARGARPAPSTSPIGPVGRPARRARRSRPRSIRSSPAGRTAPAQAGPDRRHRGTGPHRGVRPRHAWNPGRACFSAAIRSRCSQGSRGSALGAPPGPRTRP